ncbi:hypothetical protein A5721_18890 [Mycobacterium vulneris]|nr:hypothetical protein A5721_18890 [Mycolicibacterium vulneris]
MNATANIRPIEVNDRAEVAHRNPDNGEILNLRGTVVDITNGIAILDLDDDGGNYSTPVEALVRVEQVYLAGGDLAIDADQAIATTTFAGIERGTGLRIERNPNGVVVTVFDNNAGTSIDLNISFGRAAEVTAWLHDQMYNPANDYSAHARPATGGRGR